MELRDPAYGMKIYFIPVLKLVVLGLLGGCVWVEPSCEQLAALMAGLRFELAEARPKIADLPRQLDRTVSAGDCHWYASKMTVYCTGASRMILPGERSGYTMGFPYKHANQWAWALLRSWLPTPWTSMYFPRAVRIIGSRSKAGLKDGGY